MTGRTERRTQSRKRPVSLVYVELPPSNGGMMRDLSEHGFSLRAMMPLQPSEKVPFSFNLDSTARIDGEAIVIRLEENGHVAAFEFAGLSAHSRDQIRRFLEKFDEPLPSGPAKGPIQENSSFEELRSEIRVIPTRPATPPLRLPIATPAALEPEEVPGTLAEEPPPLFKLSSIRPPADEPGPVEALGGKEEPQAAEVKAHPITEEPRAPVPVKRPVKPRVAVAKSATLPELSPALEPLSLLEVETAQSAPGWMNQFTLTRAIGIMLLFTLVAGSFVYRRELGHAIIWLGQKIAGDETPLNRQPAAIPGASDSEAGPTNASRDVNTNRVPAKPENPPAPASQPAPDAASQGENLPAASETSPAPKVKDGTAPSLVPLTQVTRTPSASHPGPASEPGGSEYQRAIAILNTSDRNAELPEAARLLWAAVEKGNLAAEVMLADLYRTGRGVSRNCVQAKILLATAARKGSAEARKQLSELQQEGCSD